MLEHTLHSTLENICNKICKSKPERKKEMFDDKKCELDEENCLETPEIGPTCNEMTLKFHLMNP